MTEKEADFAFDAPQFYDFSNAECVEESPEKLEEYFNVDHSECEKVTDNEVVQESMELQEFYTPMTQSLHQSQCQEESPEILQLRRSMSMGSILPTQQLTDDHNLAAKMSELDVTQKVSAQKERKSRLADNINRLAQPKRLYASTEDLVPDKFVSMAELVKRFQNGTPVRFRTKPSTNSGNRPHNTVPYSPALCTKTRNRPVYALSREEKEKQELEEAKKFKIRAHPVNKKIMQGPMKPLSTVPKKPATIPEPFKITSYPKKIVAEATEKYQFHAKPVPKSVLEPVKPTRTSQKMTVPQTPSFMRRYNKVTPNKQNDVPEKRVSSAQKTARPTATQIAPFSFEKRNQEMLKRREELVQKVKEEEKKAREFHAKPMPKSLYRSSSRESSTTETSRQASFANSIRSTKSDDDSHSVAHFKARPAKVLHMKPFQPKREDRPLTMLAPFDLNTDRRAQDRADFEHKLKEKEEMIAALKRAEEEMIQRQEEEEAARMRQETKFKAKPIKKYKELKVMASNKVTEPISPRWHTDRVRNKENISNNH